MNPLSNTVTDRAISLQRLGGDEKLLATLAQFFLEDAPGLMDQLKESTECGDSKTAALKAHSLKGLSSTFEAIAFQELAAETEAFARAADIPHVRQTLPQLRLEFDKLVHELQKLIP